MCEPLHFEDIHVNDVWTSPSRTITESDIVQFAGLTGDFDPLHVDHQYAAEGPYGRPIAHGLLGLSYMAGLSSTAPRVKTTAFTKIGNWQFLKPIFVGDTLTVVTQVLQVSQYGRRHGEVVWLRKIKNQRGEIVQQGDLTTIVARREILARPKTVVQTSKTSVDAMSVLSPGER